MKLFLIIIGLIFCLYVAVRLVKKFAKRETANHLSKENIVETYPCILIAENVYKQKYNGYIWDFSKYKEKQIIGMQIYTKDKKPKILEGIEIEPLLIKTVVYKMKDGNYIWDHTKGGYI